MPVSKSYYINKEGHLIKVSLKEYEQLVVSPIEATAKADAMVWEDIEQEESNAV